MYSGSLDMPYKAYYTGFTKLTPSFGQTESKVKSGCTVDLYWDMPYNGYYTGFTKGIPFLGQTQSKINAY